MYLGILHFLSSIEILLLKVTLIAFSKYERAISAKFVNDFCFESGIFVLDVHRNKNLLVQFSHVWLMLSKKRQS